MNFIIVTYLRLDEKIKQSLLDAIEALLSCEFNVVLCVFSSEKITLDSAFSFVNIVDGGRTKYARIKDIIALYPSGIIVSIDNDMTIDSAQLVLLCKEFLSSSASISWGLISVSNSGFVPDLVYIDKNLSHRIIRPLLWKTGVGISVPGQCFIFRSRHFASLLPDEDTYLDDLQIGLIANNNKMPVYFSKCIIGYEEAKTSLSALIKQRKRWADGYSSVLIAGLAMNKKSILKILLHGFSYHLILPILITAYIMFFVVYPLPSLLSFLAICLILSIRDIRLFIPMIMYPFIFSFLHIEWLCLVIMLFIIKLYGRKVNKTL